MGSYLIKSMKSLLKPFKPAMVETLGTYYGINHKNLLEQTLTIFLFHDVSHSPSEFSRNYNLNTSPEIFRYQIQFIHVCSFLIILGDFKFIIVDPINEMLWFIRNPKK